MKTFFYLFLLLSAGLSSEELNLKISLKNGTTGGIGQAESVKLLALQGGMVPVGEKNNVSGSFTFEKVEAPEGVPILIQVISSGVNYNKMVPPVPAIRAKLQEIMVYNTTIKPDDVAIRSVIQVLREEDFLRVYKVYLISNNTHPPMSYFDKENLPEIYVPENAVQVFGQLTQGDSKMGIPLSLPNGKEGKVLDRAILPGMSELQISYAIPAEDIADVKMEDKFLFEKRETERVIFYRPPDMKIQVNGALDVKQLNDADIPEGLQGLIVRYPDTKKVEIAFKGGTPIRQAANPNERKIVNGTLFASWDKSLLGVIAFLGILFSLSFIFVYRKK